jgi:hypothetical protein
VSLFASQFSAPEPSIQLQGLGDNGDRVRRSEQILNDDLFVFERFVVFEEAPHLTEHVTGQLVLVARGRETMMLLAQQLAHN